MKKTGSKNYTRREFVKAAGAVTLSAAIGGPMVIPRKASAQKKTVSILHWSHFVPPFNPELQRQVEEWGKLKGRRSTGRFHSHPRSAGKAGG